MPSKRKVVTCAKCAQQLKREQIKTLKSKKRTEMLLLKLSIWKPLMVLMKAISVLEQSHVQ